MASWLIPALLSAPDYLSVVVHCLISHLFQQTVHLTGYYRASPPFERIYIMCLGKPGGPWRSPGLKFAPEAALRCQALPLSKRLSLWSGWVGQKRFSG